jgi:hypothetical protein
MLAELFDRKHAIHFYPPARGSMLLWASAQLRRKITCPFGLIQDVDYLDAACAVERRRQIRFITDFQAQQGLTHWGKHRELARAGSASVG